MMMMIIITMDIYMAQNPMSNLSRNAPHKRMQKNIQTIQWTEGKRETGGGGGGEHFNVNVTAERAMLTAVNYEGEGST